MEILLCHLNFQSQFGEVQSLFPDAWSMIPEFILTISFYLTVTENGTKKLLTFLVSKKGTILAQKCRLFTKKLLTSTKFRGACSYKAYFRKLFMFLYLCTKSQVSCMIITIFVEEWGDGGITNH